MMKATKTWVLIFLLLIPVISFGTHALAMSRETEPNNTFSQVNAFQLNGEEFVRQLSSGSDVDVFKFNVSTQGILSFSIGSAYNGYGSLRATIKDSSSNILASKSFRDILAL